MSDIFYRGAHVKELDITASLAQPFPTDQTKMFLRSADSLDILLASDGLQGCNFSKFEIDTAQALTSGVARYSALPLVRGSVIRNLFFLVSVNAGTVTTIKAGLYTKAGVQVAVSDNAATAFDTDDAYASIALNAAYTVPTTGTYLAAVLSVATTAGTLGAVAGIAGKGTAIGSGAVIAGTESSLTDLNATATITTATAPLWVGWN